MLRDGTIRKGERVVAILTGHILKDPGILIDYHKDAKQARANPPFEIDASIDAVERVLDSGVPGQSR
jgi:threonine synthase